MAAPFVARTLRTLRYIITVYLRLHIMYEPIVLRKKKPHSLVGTPAGKVNLIVNFMLTVLPFVGVVLVSRYLIKKKQIIYELEGPSKPTLEEEFMGSRAFWSKYTNIAAHVAHRKYQRENQLEESSHASSPEITESDS